MSEMYAPHDPWDGIQGHYDDQDRVRENGTRLATVLVDVDSTGGGEILHDGVLSLDAAFTERPGISHGMFIESEDLVQGFYPRVTSFVHGWQRTTKGLYVGAYVGFNVDFPVGVDADYANNLTIEHTFTFHGYAMKRLPDYLLDT